MSEMMDQIISDSPFKLTGNKSDPSMINYDIYGLHKKLTFNNRGELNVVDYYREYDGSTYSDLVLKETRVYTRDAVTGWVQMRQMTIDWYTEAGTVGKTKVTYKYYTAAQSYDEGKTRRGNVINNASIALLAYTTEANGIDYLNGCADEIDLYIKGSVQPLIDKVYGATEPYMLEGSPSVKDIVWYILETGR